MERKPPSRMKLAHKDAISTKVEAVVDRYPMLRSSTLRVRESEHDAHQLVDEMMKDLKERLASA